MMRAFMKSVLPLVLIICVLAACESPNRETSTPRHDTGAGDAGATPGQQSSAAPLADVDQSILELQFAKAHDQVLAHLEQGTAEARFALARLLLFEVKWARRTYVDKSSRTSADTEALTREVPYRGILRASPGVYRALAPYSRQPLRPEFYVQSSAAWDQFDYLRLITTELEEYIKTSADGAANVATARQWLGVLEPIAADEPYTPYPSGFPSMELKAKRLSEYVAVLKAIESGQLVVH